MIAASPARFRRVAVLASMAVALVFVGRTTGAGWMIVIVSAAGGLVAVAALWPALSLAGLSMKVAAPADGVAGRPVALAVDVATRRRGLVLRLLAPASEWLAVDGPASGQVVAVPGRRGVVGAVRVEVRCGAPVGLLWWRRRVTVALPRALEVAPAPVETALPREVNAGAAGGEPQRWARGGTDLVKGVREYAPGDSPRLVHWPASARHGDLLVKELEDHDRPRVAIVVDLRGPEDAAEDAASRAAGLAAAVLRAGLQLVMLTAERAGPVAGPVRSPLEAGRRLARAVAGAPAAGPIPPGTAVVRVGGLGGGADRRRQAVRHLWAT